MVNRCPSTIFDVISIDNFRENEFYGRRTYTCAIKVARKNVIGQFVHWFTIFRLTALPKNRTTNSHVYMPLNSSVIYGNGPHLVILQLYLEGLGNCSRHSACIVHM